MLSDGRKCDEELDALGLLACQDYNLGNQGNWFFSFRSGFSGFHSRMASLEEHRALVYEWHPNALLPGHERHIAIILFCMDSAFECTVFALNALGQARQPTGFRTVTDEGALRRISPRDVTGTAQTPPLPGWLALFPRFQHHCVDHSALLTLVADNHDVTKHRQSGFAGGKIRSDPPHGFYERLGVPDGHPLRSLIAPMQEILMPLRPKLPMEARSSDLADWTHLEQVIEDFRRFINEAVCLANSDAQATLQLPVSALRGS
jgi:hypothetical protein